MVDPVVKTEKGSGANYRKAHPVVQVAPAGFDLIGVGLLCGLGRFANKPNPEKNYNDRGKSDRKHG